MSYKIDCEYKVPHRAFSFKVQQLFERNYGMIVSNNAQVTVIDKKLQPINFFDFAKIADIDKIECLSIHPKKVLFAIAGNNKLCLCSFAGDVLKTLNGDICAIKYSSNGKYLWCIERIDKKHFKLKVLNALNIEKILTELICEDELYQSEFSISLLPEENKIILSLLAGQDGSLSYTVEYVNNQLTMHKLGEFADCIEPVFSDDYSKVATVVPETGISLLEYPSFKESLQYGYPEEMMSEGYELFFLSNQTLIFRMDEQYFSIDTASMKELKPFIIENHEPQGANFYYSNVQDEEGETITDVYYLTKIGDNLFGAYEDNRSSEKTNSVFLIKNISSKL